MNFALHSITSALVAASMVFVAASATPVSSATPSTIPSATFSATPTPTPNTNTTPSPPSTAASIARSSTAPNALSAATRTEDEIEALAQRLKDPKEKERRQAVEDLAHNAKPAAWNHVIDALRDPSPMVADEAQIQLGELKDAAVLKTLYGKNGLASGDGWVQLRVAEALGRVPIDVDSGALGKHLGDKDSDLRRTVLWSIERQARADRIDKKARQFLANAVAAVRKKDADPEVRAAAMLAEDACGMDVLDTLKHVGEDKSLVVQCAMMQVVAKFDAPTAFGIYKSWRVLPDERIRRQIVVLLGQLDTREAAELLVTMLEDKPSLRLAWTIVERLQDVSGLENQIDPPFWKKWVASLPKDWKASKVKAQPSDYERRYNTTTAVFVGQPLLSDRIAILVDFSGSLWEKREDGKTRKEKLDVELRRTLEALPPPTLFNLIPYTNEPIPWEKGLVPATSANVKRALKFFEDCRASGKGNFWDAAVQALADEKVDTLLVLTDGAPTGGHRWNLHLIGELLAEHNRFRHVVFDAVLVDAIKPLQDYWRKICESSGGRMLAVRLK